ncbi:MAG TPA: hypothetical protein DDY68_01880 [Porphyromonadaceae bacterium]|nr:hypothetical protein [Porphyromonadaceae bacterium]
MGAMGGISYYIGDMNESGFYQNLSGLGGAMFRYTPTLRSSVKGTLSLSGLSGRVPKDNRYPQELDASFSTTLCELSAMYEFNFFNYGDGYSYLKTKRCTPYLSIGLGVVASFPKGGNDNVISAILPLGIGVKYKVIPRLNVGLEVSFRWTFVDKLDGKSWSNPYDIGNSGSWNRDCYSFTTIFVTYNFGRRKQICNSILE